MESGSFNLTHYFLTYTLLPRIVADLGGKVRTVRSASPFQVASMDRAQSLSTAFVNLDGQACSVTFVSVRI